MKITTNTRKKSLNNKGFTLSEILIAVAIIAFLGYLVVPKFVEIFGDTKTKTTIGAIGAIKSSLTALSIKDENLIIPITEGTGVPVGSSVSGTPAQIANAARLDDVLIAYGITEKAFSAAASDSEDTITSTGLSWNKVSKRFEGSVGVDYSPIPRVESMLSAPSATPGVGSNYYLQGGTIPLGVGRTIISAVIPRMKVAKAYLISQKYDKEAWSNATLTGADTLGTITYGTPDSEGYVTIYAYLATSD